MKTNIISVALFVAAFMFPSIGSVNTADALGNYGCYKENNQGEHIRCLRTLLHDNAPAHHASPSNDGLGNWGCGGAFPAHRDCLRALLDVHAPHLSAAGSGLSGSNYNHLSNSMATGGINGVEDSSHSCTQFSGAPRTACEAAASATSMRGGPAGQDMGGNMINDGGHGANSAKESRAARIKECVAQAVTAFTKETCKGLQ
jgi:hypothetical protein